MKLALNFETTHRKIKLKVIKADLFDMKRFDLTITRPYLTFGKRYKNSTYSE